MVVEFHMKGWKDILGPSETHMSGQGYQNAQKELKCYVGIYDWWIFVNRIG